QQHLAAKQPHGELPTVTEGVKTSDRDRHGFAERFGVRWMTRVLIYGQAAALLAFAVLGWVYVSRVSKERAVFHDQVVHTVLEVTSPKQWQSPVVLLTLVSDRSRATEAQMPQVEITTTTQRVIVEIALTGSKAGPYDLHLETRDGRG